MCWLLVMMGTVFASLVYYIDSCQKELCLKLPDFQRLIMIMVIWSMTRLKAEENNQDHHKASSKTIFDLMETQLQN